MSTITIDYLRNIAPEYNTFTDVARFNALKSIAELSVNPTYFGSKTDPATAYLVAHMLKIGERVGMAGNVESNRVGDVSQTYRLQNGSDAELSTTSYGCEFVRLKKSCRKTPVMW